MKRSILKSMAILFVCSFCLTGCSGSSGAQLTEVPRKLYQKNEYKTVKVTRGDMDPILELTLKPQDVEKMNYSVVEQDLEVEDVLVNVGDNVKAGQVLVTFKSDEIKKNIENYSNELVKKQLLLDHYSRMYNVDLEDKDEKYSVILQELTDDVEIAKLYLAEEQQRYDACQIKADRDGTVSFISKAILSGYVEPEQTLLTVSCGRNLFAANTKDSYNFSADEVYTAEYKDDSFEMKLVEIIEENDFSRTVVFEPVGVTLNISTSETMNMIIHKPALSNVIYVDKQAINKKNDESFVYVVKENGFLNAVYVEVGEEVDGMVAILRGLDGSEEVAIK